jgi:hypothetical protein
LQVESLSLVAVITIELFPEFLKWTCQGSIFGTFHCHFWGIQDESKSWSANSIEPGQTSRRADWPGSILVAKTNHFGTQQDNG